MLALSRRAFDQDLQGGWRAVSARDGCIAAAADLIRDYRERHRLNDTILFWHEGQLRASDGQTEAASALFERSRKEPADAFGWNQYVDATIAFLRNDRPALLAARASLAGLPRPSGFEPRDPQGRPISLSWPMNLDVVDGLIACFGRSYREAYGPACRSDPARTAAPRS
jgi:hypothetical protein